MSSFLRTLLVCALVVACSCGSARAAKSGAEIYRSLCASCHGANGEGSKAYALPLLGDKSVGELAELIHRTMPEGEPEKCHGDDARSVAQYLYDAFYSPTAQARNKPARVELSRLTVRQYGETLTDLIASFRAPVKTNEGVKVEPGLWGEYFRTKRFGDKSRLFARLDKTIKFNFGDQNPHPDGDAAEFAVRWQGSILPVETGDHEFIVRAENGIQLWVNDQVKPLIDASVRSGKESIYRESIRLTAGRAYPIRLELHKSKTAKDVTAAVELRWKPPHRAEELIPTFHFSTAMPGEAFVLQTPFPPDDRSTGYERGTDVSKAWEQATTDGAIEAAAFLSARLREITGLNEGDAKRPAKLRLFCEQFLERAFRRPLTDEQKKLYIERQFAEAKSPELAVQRVVLLGLKSPRFLFREIGAPARDPFTVAERLSFALCDSLPDAVLFEAARAGKLQTPAEIREQAERLAADPRARAKLREFFLQWIKVDHFGDLSKDRKKFPEFNQELVSDLKTSLDLFLADVLGSNEADFRRLMLSDESYVNWRIAKYYGLKLPSSTPFVLVKWEPEQRAGLLTHPLLLSGLAYTDVSSPIHRGVLISRSMLGRALRPPPEAVTPLAVDLHPNLTTRERVTLQTKSETCAACHTMINNLGFALEGFDAVGKLRATEKEKPIDATGLYRTREDKQVKFTGGRELAKFLVESPETHGAVVQQLFQHLTKQPILAYGLDVPEKLRNAFTSQSFNLRSLTVEIAVTAATADPPANLTSVPKGP
jgi:cytochrome c553